MTSYQAFCLCTINRGKKNYEEARKIPIFLSTVHCSDIWEAKKAEFSTFSTNIMMEKYDQAHAISWYDHTCEIQCSTANSTVHVH